MWISLNNFTFHKFDNHNKNIILFLFIMVRPINRMNYDTDIIRYFRENNIETCCYQYNNFSITTYYDGQIIASNGNTSYIIAGDLSNYGMNRITNIIMRGEVGNREFIMSEGNKDFILDAEIIFERFRILEQSHSNIQN
jgi:hypothetical protein